MQYTHVLNELTQSVITINNLGFILFFNRQAEKIWRVKQKEALGTKINLLFAQNNSSEVIRSFLDPARTKSTGTFQQEEMVLTDGTRLQRDLMIIKTDLKDELLFTLIVL